MTLEINKIHLGDCLELMKNIPDKSINCIICDLPFGVTACEWDKIIDFKNLWEQYKRITTDGGYLPIWNGTFFYFTKNE